MKSAKDSPYIVFMGRYSGDEILSGPRKNAKRIFDLHASGNKTAFIQYFFDGRKYGFFKKLFGKEKEAINQNADLYTAGLFRVLFLLFKLRPRLIHIITFERFTVLAFFYKILANVKIVYTEHGIIAYENTGIKKVSFFYRIKDKYCEWLFLKYSDKVIFLSEQSIDIAHKYFKIDESMAIILSNGIDDDFRVKLPINTDKINDPVKAVILNVSKFSASGIEFIKRAVSKLDFPLELFVIGDKTGIDSNKDKLTIHYINRMKQQELADFYKDKDIFLSLNSYDTFSIATIEAMAAGLIPIVTEETGMTRFIIDVENGFKVNYDDPENLLNIIRKLSSDAELRKKIRTESSKIFEILSWPEVYSGYQNLYESLTQ